MCLGCVKILVDKQDRRPWDNQKLDWSLKSTADVEYEYWSLDDHSTLIKSNVMPIDIKHCICGHAICKQFNVYNDARRVCCIMGSVCICRYKANDQSERGAFTGNTMMEEQMAELNKYHCDICNKTMSTDRFIKHNSSPTHKKNYKLKNYRMCRCCKQYKIEINKPAYYHTCSGCYKFKPKLLVQY